ncbi:MAG: LPS-assembly protein LptD, partial [Azoarcus sp.]|nr:LPS-assembly protein LptD [Azoarcus sp.]
MPEAHSEQRAAPGDSPPADADACPAGETPAENGVGTGGVSVGVPGRCGKKKASGTAPAGGVGAYWQVLASSAGFGPKTAGAPSPAGPGETRISALRIHGTHAVDMVAEGDVELQRDTLTLTADRLTYREPVDEVVAEGNVRLRQGDHAEMSGPSATLVVGSRTGEFREPEYSMTRSRPPLEEGDPPRQVSGGGQADLLRLEGENQYRARNATWSSCPAPNPDWYIKARELELDYDREIGTTHGATMVFKDVPFFWLPWAEFPLVGQRHSGLLPPTMDTSTK